MPDRNTFFQQYAGLAQQAAGQLDIPASVVLGILGSESNFGNLQGANGSVSLTGEVYAGQPGAHPETFTSSNGQSVTLAMFPNPQAAMDAFVHNLSTPLYAGALQTYQQTQDPGAFIQALANAGYVQRDQSPQWVGLITSLSQQAQASIGGPVSTSRPPAQSVGLTQQAPAQQAMAPYDRRADLLERQSRGVTLGADAIAYLNSTGGQYQQQQAQQQNTSVGPNGRSFDQVTGQPYLSPEERSWYLEQQGKGLDANGNVVDLASGGGRASPRIAPPDTGDGGLQGQQPQQQTSPYIQGGGPYGNQTTLDNATAQMQMGQNYGYQQQAAQSAYNASPAVAGAYAAQQPQQQAGPMSQGDQANAQQGGAESQFATMKHGGTAKIGMKAMHVPQQASAPIPPPAQAAGMPTVGAMPPSQMANYMSPQVAAYQNAGATQAAYSRLPSAANGGQARIGMPQWTEPDRNDNPWVGPTAMPNYQRGNADSYQQPVPMPVDTDPWANQIYQYADGGAALVGGSPAKMKMQPTQPVGSPWPPVGQPAQPHMQIPEPVIGVGQFTGIPHFRIGDNPNGPELMTIVPPEGVSPGRARMKVPV